jgi:hypothetical protein
MKRTIDVLCDILIEGGAHTTKEQREETVEHLKACHECDAEGKRVVERLRAAVTREKGKEAT